MIPMIIHYCWFGGGAKNKLVENCIDSWKKTMPNCKIIEWNEHNFDVNKNKFTQQAYEARKWAFVSDYVRLFALLKCGGIYLDSDVELLKPLDPFMKYSGFGGFSDIEEIGGVYEIPSAVMGAVKGNAWIKEMLQYYTDKEFVNNDGEYNMETNASIMTRLSQNYFVHRNIRQTMSVGQIELFPMEYFEPINPVNDVNIYSPVNTYAIHWHNCSWGENETIKEKIKYKLNSFMLKLLKKHDDKMIRRDMWLNRLKIK